MQTILPRTAELLSRPSLFFLCPHLYSEGMKRPSTYVRRAAILVLMPITLKAPRFADVTVINIHANTRAVEEESARRSRTRCSAVQTPEFRRLPAVGTPVGWNPARILRSLARGGPPARGRGMGGSQARGRGS